MILLRVGYHGHPLLIDIPDYDDYDYDGYNPNVFGYMVVYGFVFITLIQIISISMGEKSPVLVSKYKIFDKK